MGAWNYGPFDNDGGLDAAFRVLDHLAGQVEQVARGTEGDRSSIVSDAEELAALVEMLRLIAESVYRPAMFVPIRGMPLPAPEVLDGWRDEFLARCSRLAPKQVKSASAEQERFAQEAAAPLARLAKLSQQQADSSPAVHQQMMAEVVEARRREAAGE